MATMYWRGDAQAVAQVDHFTPANVEIGDVFTITINGKDVSFTATAATVANVVAGLVAAIGQYDSTIPEFAKVSASSGTDSDGNVTHLVLTGPTTGEPFTATASTSDSGTFGVTVTTIEAGSAAVNEKQLVDFRGTPTGGTFTITFDGQTTGNIAYNANAATVQTALEALSNIASGDVEVTGSAGSWTVEFKQAYAGTNVPLMTADGTNLTGACSISVATSTEGAPGTNEVTRLVLQTGYTIRLQWQDPSVRTGFVTVGTTAAQLQSEINALTGISGVGSVVVTKTADQVSDLGDYEATFDGYGGSIWDIEWVGGFAGTNVGIFVLVDTSGTTHSQQYIVGGVTRATVTEETQGSSTAIDEVQTVTVLGGPTAGTFTLTFSGQTTSGIAYNAAASAVKSALEALSNVTTVTVTGDAGGPYTVTFTDPGGQDVAQMTGSAASLTGGAVDIATTQAAVAAVNERQQVELTGSPSGGTFTLTWDPGGGDETTGNIAYGASAATVQTALEGLTTPTSGDFDVTGADGGPWLVEFTGSYAGSNVNAMSGDAGNLTGGGSQTLSKSSATTPTGPNWWDVAENFSGGSLPVNGDTVIFENHDVDCLYGLDGLSAVTLAALHFRASYTGRVGLDRYNANEYYEYLPTEMEIGATALYVGEGDGSGSPQIRINTGSVQTAAIVRGTGTSDDDLPAFVWRGTHASNVVRVYAGSVGIGVEQHLQAATVATLDVGQQGNIESDASVIVGDNVTLTTVNKYGGDLRCGSACTTLVQDNGETILVGTGAYTTLTVRGGDLVYSSTGTITTLTVASEGTADFTQDLRGRTITNTTLEAGATLDDSFGTITFTNDIALSNCGLQDVTIRSKRGVSVGVA